MKKYNKSTDLDNICHLLYLALTDKLKPYEAVCIDSGYDTFPMGCLSFRYFLGSM